MPAYIAGFRGGDRPFDVVRAANLPEGEPGAEAGAITEYEHAGVTWWLEPIEDDMTPLDDLRARIRTGPPVG